MKKQVGTLQEADKDPDIVCLFLGISRSEVPNALRAGV